MAYLRWNGWRIYHESMGQGPPMLFVHGWSQSVRCWDAVAAQLAETHHVVRLDLLGFGSSDKPYNFSYRVEDLALLVKDFMEDQQLEDVTLVGHSLGGAVSLLASLLTPPQRLSGLVLMNVPFNGPSAVLRTVGGLTPFPELWYALGQRADIVVKCAAWLAKGSWTANSCIEEDVRRAGAFAGGRSARSVIQLDLSHSARQVKVPTLVIGSDRDRIVPRSSAGELAALIPDARLVVLRDVYHLPMMEVPQETLRLLRTFASEIRPLPETRSA
ncbi:MAG: alpha/beta fold hydrolase [Candidatus Xenobia bacterium]